MVVVLKKPVFLCLFLFSFGSIHCVAKNKGVTLAKQGENKEAQYLLVPPMANNSRVVSNKQAIEQAPADSTILHIVKQGETLYSISNEYGVSVPDIKQWNHLTSNSIQVGEKLKIFPSEVSRTTSSSRPKTSSKAGRYTVKPGDTLFRIAQMHQMSVEQLKGLNNLASNTIRIGQKLIVSSVGSSEQENKSAIYGKFISYTVNKTVSRNTLLNKFGMGEGEFLALNPGLNDTTFSVGDQVKVLIPAQEPPQNPYQVKETVRGIGMMAATKYPPDTWGTTTNGELYNPKTLTAGSSTLKIGTIIFIKNKQSGRGVFVRINDRTTGNGLKLSEAAWEALQLANNDNKVVAFRANE